MRASFECVLLLTWWRTMAPPTEPEARRSRCVERETQMTGVSWPQRMATHCRACVSAEEEAVEEEAVWAEEEVGEGGPSSPLLPPLALAPR